MTLVTAHRGDSSRLRENTIAAINSAITHHADIVEVDIRKTSDGQVILLHDQTLERLWGVPLTEWYCFPSCSRASRRWWCFVPIRR